METQALENLSYTAKDALVRRFISCINIEVDSKSAVETPFLFFVTMYLTYMVTWSVHFK